MTSKAQLQLFEENDEASLIRQEVAAMRKHYEKNWKTLQTRHNELVKLFLQLKEENDSLKLRLQELEKNHKNTHQNHDEDLIERLFKEVYQSPS